MRYIHYLTRRLKWAHRILLLSGFSAYLIVMTQFGRFPVIDEVYFKAAGRQWFSTGQFAAPELTGFINTSPPVERMWAVYPPCYPFLFGVFCRLAGFGAQQCIAYDALIHVLLAGLTYITIRRVEGRISCWIALPVGLSVLPLGHAGRPDELGMCFAMAGLLPLLRPAVGLVSVLASGIFFGFAALTSTGVAVAIGLIAATTIMVRLAEPSIGRFIALLVWAGTATVLVIGSLAPFLIAEPGLLKQYTTAAAYSGVTGGPSFTALAFFWRFGRPTLILTVSCLLLAFVSLGIESASGRLNDWIKLWLGPVISSLVIILGLSARYTYLWFVGPWLLCACSVQVYWMIACGRSRIACGLLSLLVVGYILAVEPSVKVALILLQLPEEQALAVNERHVREIIPENAVVVADDYWWSLAGRNRIYDPNWSRPSLDQIEFVVLTGNGSGTPGQPKRLSPAFAEHIKAHFEPVYDNLNRSPQHVLGVRITNSAYGYGPLVLKRRGQTRSRAASPSVGGAVPSEP